MIAVVGGRAWEMTRGQWEGLLQVASEAVPRGVYAVERGGMGELVRQEAASAGEVDALVAGWERDGYCAHANR